MDWLTSQTEMGFRVGVHKGLNVPPIIDVVCATFPKPSAKPVIPGGGAWGGPSTVVHGTPADNRVSPEKETGQRQTTVEGLRARWEIAAATGTPLNPADDLTRAAMKLAAGRGRSPGLGRNHQQQHSSRTELKTERQTSKSNLPSVVSEHPPQIHAEQEDSESAESADEEPRFTTPDEPETYTSSETSSTHEREEKDNRQSQDSEEFGSELDECLEDALESMDSATKDDSWTDILHSKEEQDLLTPLTTPSHPSTVHQSSNYSEESGSLVHSVSFYRAKQRESRAAGSAGATPVVVKHPRSPLGKPAPNQVTGEERKAARAAYEEKIKALSEAQTVQQEQISQASRALNFCRTTQEFRGSREEVDAQRALLLATERRKCIIEELDRVKRRRKEGGLMESEGPRGTLTISQICIPLKREFLNDNVNMGSGDLLHYFICLVKHRESVHATQMVTSDEAMRSRHLEFSNYIQMKGLPNDFIVRVEVYGLRTKREELTHEEKYKIKGGTLKKSKTLFSTGVSSPGGPMAVLDPSFQRLGFLVLGMGSLGRGRFRMEEVQFSCPLDSTLMMSLRCYAESAGVVEHQGFLSAFEEVGGLGSWTRFWCVLEKGSISFWRYPDEQNVKDPLNVVKLSQCITVEARLVDREMCSKPNTFFIDIAAEMDPRIGSSETYRIMLSADARDECTRWRHVINQTLEDTRMWSVGAHHSAN